MRITKPPSSPTRYLPPRSSDVSRARRARFEEALAVFGLTRRPVHAPRPPAEGEAFPDFTELIASLDSEEMAELVEVICTRDLGDTAYPFVVIDVMPPSEDTSHVEANDLVTVTGVTCEGDFEPLGFVTGVIGEVGFWERFLCSLLVRGLHGVAVVGSPDIEALLTVLPSVFPEVQWRDVGPIESVSVDAAIEVIRESGTRTDSA